MFLLAEANIRPPIVKFKAAAWLLLHVKGVCDDYWYDFVDYFGPDAVGRLARVGSQSRLGLWPQRRSRAAGGGHSGVGAHGAHLTVSAPPSLPLPLPLRRGRDCIFQSYVQCPAKTLYQRDPEYFMNRFLFIIVLIVVGIGCLGFY